MPSKIVNELIQKVEHLKDDLTAHLIESGSIKAQLKLNTWLTGVILVAIIAMVFKK